MYTSFTDWESGLTHHGVKGMHWGERRYQNEDGSLTAAGRQHYGKSDGGSKKMSRQYNRTVRRLNRLQQRTDKNIQRSIAKKYDRRAKIAGAAALGLGAAAVGSHFKTASDNVKESLAWKSTHDLHDKAQSAALEKMFEGVRLPGGIDGASYNHLQNVFYREGAAADRAFKNYVSLKKQGTFGTASVSTRTKVLAGAAGVAAGYAAYSKIRSSIAKRRMSDVGHNKAVQKYRAQYDKAVKKFANTPYSSLLKKNRTSSKGR